jgi:hypothetical protein
VERLRLAPPAAQAFDFRGCGRSRDPLIYLGVHFSSPGSKGVAYGPAVVVPSYSEPKQVPFTAEKKRDVRKRRSRS